MGLIQTNQSLLKEYQLNTRRLHFKEKDIDYIVVGHVHADHICGIPRLYARGCKAQIIIPEGNRSLFREMCLDSAKIMAKDALDLTKKFKKFYPPIYQEEDVKKSLVFLKEVPEKVKYKLDDDITIEFIPSGHIINSYQIVLYIKNGSHIKKLAFTSDLGNVSVPNLYNNVFEPIQNANLLVGECTYANREKSIKAKDREKDIEKIKSAVYDVCIDGKGKILFPSFSLMRSQVIVTILYDLFEKDEKFNVPIYVGSPLTCKINDIFLDELSGNDLAKWKKVIQWDKIHFVRDFDSIEEALNKNENAIFVCSSGMMQGGYSVYCAKKILPNPNNMIIFIGYSVENSLSWKIKQKKTKTVNIDGKPVSSKCRIINLNSFSSHMQRTDLIKYYSGGFGTGLYEKIALVHGDFKDKVEFGRDLQEEISKRNRTDRVIIVNKSTEILV